eukprot:2854041-Amphidinium_carterae.1
MPFANMRAVIFGSRKEESALHVISHIDLPSARNGSFSRSVQRECCEDRSDQAAKETRTLRLPLLEQQPSRISTSE